MQAISVKNLKIKYGNFTAVDNISFTINKGEVFGIIGPNGAGKTSTLECIEGLRRQESGDIEILGIRPQNRSELYAKIGIQLQETNLQDNVKILELIDLYRSFYENPADYEPLLEMFELTPFKNRLVKKLSGGQKQKLNIILALIGNPQILFLDEISTGLDPHARKQIWGIIRELQKQGKTIVMTTHFMEEAEELCDRICLMVGGKISAIGTINELTQSAGIPISVTFKLASGQMITKNLQSPKEIATAVEKQSAISEIVDIDIYKPTLEDIFFKLTGTKLEEKNK